MINAGSELACCNIDHNLMYVKKGLFLRQIFDNDYDFYVECTVCTKPLNKTDNYFTCYEDYFTACQECFTTYLNPKIVKNQREYLTVDLSASEFPDDYILCPEGHYLIPCYGNMKTMYRPSDYNQTHQCSVCNA
jgi:hypothetical protein